MHEQLFWGESKGGSGGSVEPPKLNSGTLNCRRITVEELNVYLKALSTVDLAQANLTKYNLSSLYILRERLISRMSHGNVTQPLRTSRSDPKDGLTEH